MAEKQPKFEEALTELEDIIAQLESGQLTLDESLERYERGIKALAACRTILGEAEKKIQLLLCTPEGKLQTQPYEAEEIIQEAEEEPGEDEEAPF